MNKILKNILINKTSNNQIVKTMKTFINDFIALFYPNYCYICGNSLVKNEECVCSQCLISLPKTNFHLHDNNPLVYLFAGKVQVSAVTAYFYFKKGNTIQTLIHQLKYKGQQDIGLYFGFLLGSDLTQNKIYESIDIIIPIPLHPNKKKKRGYNQSEIIASGVAKAMNKALDITSLVRTVETDTQTKKTQYNRWENTSEVFKVVHPSALEGKHVLLIDDVITTGSTLEAAIQSILSIKKTKVSVACLACAVL